MCSTFNFYFWARQDDEFIVWSMSRATSPASPRSPRGIEAISIKKKSKCPSTVCIGKRQPTVRAGTRVSHAAYPRPSWWRTTQIGLFIFKRRFFFFFFTVCQQKICGQSCYTFHTADFISVRAIMTHLHFLVHLGLFLWLLYSEEAYKSWPVQWWNTLPMEFWGASQQWKGGHESVSELRVTEVLHFAAGRNLVQGNPPLFNYEGIETRKRGVGPYPRSQVSLGT